jgi:hypothetical protein
MRENAHCRPTFPGCFSSPALGTSSFKITSSTLMCRPSKASCLPTTSPCTASRETNHVIQKPADGKESCVSLDSGHVSCFPGDILQLNAIVALIEVSSQKLYTHIPVMTIIPRPRYSGAFYLPLMLTGDGGLFHFRTDI